jgi:hypothetical protein
MVFYAFYIDKEQIAVHKKWPCHADVSRTYCLGAQDMMFLLRKIHALYIDKEQKAGPKNYNVMRKCPGNLFWVKALVFILCKEDPPKLDKNESATESEKIVYKALAEEYGCFYEIS